MSCVQFACLHPAAHMRVCMEMNPCYMMLCRESPASCARASYVLLSCCMSNNSMIFCAKAFCLWRYFPQPRPRQQCPCESPSADPRSVPEQGLSTWVGLKSRRGEPVGAVQIKVSLNRLLGQCQLDHRYPPHPPAALPGPHNTVQIGAYLLSQSANT